VGGIAVVFATTVSFVAWSFPVLPGNLARPEILGMLLGGLAIFLVGFWDDTRPVRATTKFALQVLVTSAAFIVGVRILGVEFGGMWVSQLTAVTSFFVTLLFVVGTTNAFNLIDGSDGVAGGAAMFASLSMGIIFALNGDPLGALMATILVGACLGFLFFNFPPASIFLGDCGSLFLGFTLATLGVITTNKSSTLLAVAIPVIAFGVPLLDTMIAIIRRYLRHEPIFAPDRGHIHHRLRDLGMSPRAVAALLYVACAGCASLSMLLAAPGRPTVLPVFVVASAVLILGVQRLNVPELTELSRVLGRGLQQRSVISHNVRLYQAAQALSEAGSAREVVEALTKAFEGSEFSRVEIWIPESLGRALKGLEGVVHDADGRRLSLTFEHVLNPAQEIEVRIPISADGRVGGRISLYRSTAGPRLFTDLRLVAKLMVPALHETLRRLAGSPAEGESQVGL
jgi:UDP-GlcNAc:undecaprenyl-phosphate GlcNAc-1-phosphate transferase